MDLSVFLPEDRHRDARTLQLARQGRPVRFDPPPLALRDPGPTKQPSFQSLVGDVVGQWPCQPGRRRSLQIVLDRRALFLKLSTCDWIAERRNLLLTGASGLGKSWLACALGHKACRENLSVLYTRMPRLFADLAIAHGDARYARLLRSLARVKLLILDDWGPEALTPDQARDLLEIVEDRYDKGSIIITSQVPVDRWHDLIGVPTLADAILDRVIHNAYRIELAGESLRKRPSSS
jgi:DNA replication protein DnaC